MYICLLAVLGCGAYLPAVPAVLGVLRLLCYAVLAVLCLLAVPPMHQSNIRMHSSCIHMHLYASICPRYTSVSNILHMVDRNDSRIPTMFQSQKYNSVM